MERQPRRVRHTLACVAATAVLACGEARDATTIAPVNLTGAGATFPYPLYRAWFSEYAAHARVRINYFSVGSAEGLRLLDQGEADFGASDLAVQPATGVRAPGCARIAVPSVRGPIAVAYNLPAASGEPIPLRFDAALLAAIFSGKVTRWNAPEIAGINPGVTLPATLITVVHRGTGSGTSRAFSDFLSTSGRWKGGTVGDTTEVHWPVGLAAEGNEGVAMEVKVTIGAIGYVELAYARQNRLSVGRVKGAANEFLSPGSESPGYPISARTWLVIDPTHVPAERGTPLVAFVRWALHEGAEQARAMEYTPIDADTVSKYDSLLKTIRFDRCAKPATR